MVLSFRGDACHLVERFNTTASGKSRVSLVMEQYKIKPKHMHLVEPMTTSISLPML